MIEKIPPRLSIIGEETVKIYDCWILMQLILCLTTTAEAEINKKNKITFNHISWN